MNRTPEQCVSGAALAPLTSEQRQKLARLARRAYERGPRNAERGTFDAWRRREVLLTVERAGLRECRQEDFAPVKAHFLGLLGQTEMAGRIRERSTMEPRRRALWALAREMNSQAKTLGDPIAYASAIARCKFKTTRLPFVRVPGGAIGIAEQEVSGCELSAKQLLSLVFDVRRGAQKKRGGEWEPRNTRRTRNAAEEEVPF